MTAAVKMLPALEEEAKKRQSPGTNQWSPAALQATKKETGEAAEQAARIVGAQRVEARIGQLLGDPSVAERSGKPLPSTVRVVSPQDRQRFRVLARGLAPKGPPASRLIAAAVRLGT